MLVLALTLAAFVAQPDTAFRPAPAVADTGETVEEEVLDIADDVVGARVRPIVSPSTLYSPSKGVGIGGGVAVDGLFRPDDHLQVEARLAQRLQGAFGEYVTADPDRSRLFGHFGAAAWTTTRTRFVGHGPDSPADAELFLDRLAAEAEVRLGWMPRPGGAVLIEPTLRVRYDRLRGYEETVEGGLAEIDGRDLARLDALEGEARYGGEAALIAVVDTRDIPSMPSRGLYAHAEAARFQAADGSGLGFTRAEALAYLFRPALLQLPYIPDRGAFFVRFNGVITRQDGDDPLPWVYLPDLDGDLLVGYPRSEFVGRDAISLGVGVRGVIGQAIGAFLVEGGRDGARRGRLRRRVRPVHPARPVHPDPRRGGRGGPAPPVGRGGPERPVHRPRAPADRGARGGRPRRHLVRLAPARVRARRLPPASAVAAPPGGRQAGRPRTARSGLPRWGVPRARGTLVSDPAPRAVPAPPLFAVGYSSVPARPLDAAETDALVSRSATSNRTKGVTGQLLFIEDGDRVVRYVQWFEGPQDVALDLLHRISNDDRHYDLRISFVGSVPERRYPEWSMRHRRLPTEALDRARVWTPEASNLPVRDAVFDIVGQ